MKQAEKPFEDAGGAGCFFNPIFSFCLNIILVLALLVALGNLLFGEQLMQDGAIFLPLVFAGLVFTILLRPSGAGTNVPAQITRSDFRPDLPTGFASRPGQTPFHFGNAVRIFLAPQFEQVNRQPAELFGSILPALAAGHPASHVNLTRLDHSESA
jgi:hypothetical protein